MFSSSSSRSALFIEMVASVFAFSICLKKVSKCTFVVFTKFSPRSLLTRTFLILFFVGVERRALIGESTCKYELTTFKALLILSTNLTCDWKPSSCMLSLKAGVSVMFSTAHFV